jgi:diguanylate cyclase (GGDEF)-like protein
MKKLLGLRTHRLRHSLRIRITVITISAILASFLSFAVAGFFTVGREASSSSAEKMHLISKNAQQSLDALLDSIKQSAFSMSRIASDSLDGLVLIHNAANKSPTERTHQQTSQLDTYITNYCTKVQETMGSIASHTKGVVAYYYCINPNVSSNEHGFYYSRMGKVGFEEQAPVDVSKLDSHDTEHNAWYFIPMRKGAPSWVGPYKDTHLNDALTITYVSPVYKSGVLIGVLGMDMLFDTMIGEINSLAIYDSGYACLLSQENEVLYHPELKRGDVPGFVSQIQSTGKTDVETSGNAIITYEDEGKRWQLSFSTLSNGMKLVVCAPIDEVAASWHHLEASVVVIALVVLVLFIPATLIAMSAVNRPLRQLTEAARQLSEGNYDVELDYNKDDEIGELTTAFKTLRDHLRVYISNLNSQAYIDSLTHVKNKGAYDIYAARINDKISHASSQDDLQFAIVMFDCNSLKFINDTYGHDKGDIYLKTACKLICQVYEHSPVFRIGGDEFIALLFGYDYDNREKLFSEFDERVCSLNATAENPWDIVDIAKGMSTYRWCEDKDMEMVWHRSDQRMYAAKQLRYAKRS